MYVIFNYLQVLLIYFLSIGRWFTVTGAKYFSSFLEQKLMLLLYFWLKYRRPIERKGLNVGIISESFYWCQHLKELRSGAVYYTKRSNLWTILFLNILSTCFSGSSEGNMSLQVISKNKRNLCYFAMNMSTLELPFIRALGSDVSFEAASEMILVRTGKPSKLLKVFSNWILDSLKWTWDAGNIKSYQYFCQSTHPLATCTKK